MFVITKYTNTLNWGVGASICFASDKDKALDLFGPIIQAELFFLDEYDVFTSLIEKNVANDYPDGTNTVVHDDMSLTIWTSPEGLTIVVFCDALDTYAFQLAEVSENLLLTL